MRKVLHSPMSSNHIFKAKKKNHYFCVWKWSIQCTIKLILHSANAGDMAITDVLKQKCSCQAEFMSHRMGQFLSFWSTLGSKPTVSEEWRSRLRIHSRDRLPILFISSLFPELLLHVILNFPPIWQHSSDEDRVEQQGRYRVEAGEGKELTFWGIYTLGPLDLNLTVTPGVGVTQLSFDKSLFGTQICAIPKLFPLNHADPIIPWTMLKFFSLIPTEFHKGGTRWREFRVNII